MNRTSASTLAFAAAVLAGVTLSLGTTAARQDPLAVDKDDLAGVVTSAKGPEAGVWVIAETSDLPTKFAKIVVTDDRGRYLLPDLPAGQVQRVGAGLRAGRLDQGRGHTRQGHEPERRDRPECARRGASIIRPDTGSR